MARKAKATVNPTDAAPVNWGDIPPDYEDLVTEESADGIWSEDVGTPLFFTPRTARVFDGEFDKPSVLVLGTVNRATKAYQRDKDGNPLEVELQPGQLVGVFARPGMRGLRMCADCPIGLARDPSKDKDLDKGNPMKGYAIKVSKGAQPKRLVASVDARKKTRTIPTILDEPMNTVQTNAQNMGGKIDLEDIPF